MCTSSWPTVSTDWNNFQCCCCANHDGSPRVSAPSDPGIDLHVSWFGIPWNPYSPTCSTCVSKSPSWSCDCDCRIRTSDPIRSTAHLQWLSTRLAPPCAQDWCAIARTSWSHQCRAASHRWPLQLSGLCGTRNVDFSRLGSLQRHPRSMWDPSKRVWILGPSTCWSVHVARNSRRWRSAAILDHRGLWGNGSTPEHEQIQESMRSTGSVSRLSESHIRHKFPSWPCSGCNRHWEAHGGV